MAKTYKGVDISEHNGAINWVKLKNSVDFVILRVGWVGNKGNHTLDKKFKTYYEACKKHGIKVGAYVYMYSNSQNTAQDGAEWTLKQLKGKTLDLPVYCDMEDPSIKGLGKAKLTAITEAFNSVIEKGGFWAGVYANRDWFDNYLDGAALRKRYTSWIAHYTSGTSKYSGEYDMWQNSSTGRADGISGNVDTNYLYRDLFSAIKGNKSNSYKVKVTTAVLNIRAGAGTSYKINGTVKQNEIYTITQTKGDWGKLKSGKGWICLKYTKKV